MELTLEHIQLAALYGACEDAIDNMAPGMSVEDIPQHHLVWCEDRMPKAVLPESPVPLWAMARSGFGYGYGDGAILPGFGEEDADDGD